MRIGISINSAWNIYNFRRGLIKGIQSEGHQVVAIAPHDEYANKLEEMGCEFIHLEMENKGTNPLTDLALAFRLGRVYKKAKLDAVLQFTIKPNIYGSLAAGFMSLFARTTKLPVINNVTGLGTVFIRENELSSKIAKLLYRFAFRYPNVVFFQNPDDKKVFLKESLVPRAVVDLLPGSGINLQEFQPKPSKNKQAFTFLMISRLIVDKGVYELIEAIRKMRARGNDSIFKIVGPLDLAGGLGISQEEIDSWVSEGLIEYLGKQSDVRPFIENADCVILPSYREGTPRTLIEAASMAKPIVTTNVPGCRETVEHGFNGFLCEVKNADDLAIKLLEMSNQSKAELEEMGKNSRKLAESKFDEKIVVSKYLRHIRSFDKRKHQTKNSYVPYLVSYLWGKIMPYRQRD